MSKMQRAAQHAIQVQNSCDLSGVIRQWNEIVIDLWEEANRQGRGTEWVNRHPINKLFANKVVQLTQLDESKFGLDYEWVKEVADDLVTK